MIFSNGLARLTIAALAALVITTVLLLIMQALIHGNDVAIEKQSNKIADIFMGKTEIEVKRTEKKPEKPQPQEEPPEPIELDQLDDAQVNADALSLQPSLKANMDFKGPGLNASDGEYLPFVKVQPAYPRRAQARGVQGFCTVAYTVTKQGTTKDIRIVDCSSKLFERSSIQAAQKFKYKPRIIDGEAIEVPNVKNRFNYKLQ